jgi:hypothetical protein
LPTYSDPENSTFHPPFAYAFQEVLKRRNMEDQYELRPQYPTATGPVDFALLRKRGGVVFPIEIKRTKESLRGGGRRQARDYHNNLGGSVKTPFYCVSNLELTELFKSDASRPHTVTQKIKLDGDIGVLPLDGADVFYESLERCIHDILSIVVDDAPHEFDQSLATFNERLIGNEGYWDPTMVPFYYEYIRGSSARNELVSSKIKRWKPAPLYLNSPKMLLDVGHQIGFDPIFSGRANSIPGREAFHGALLKEGYVAGTATASGEDVAELVNDLLAPKDYGIVQTDPELARILGALCLVELERPLAGSEKVLDPCAGSGRLLTALPQSGFPDLQASQIIAVEREHRFAAPLALRLGLTFGCSTDESGRASIAIQSFEECSRDTFADVKLVVMNPPYLSGVQVGDRRREGFIRQLSNFRGGTRFGSGQPSLELFFLETVYESVSDGAVIAAIIPIQHLFRSSPEIASFRRFLVDEFSISIIATYQASGLFKGVSKETCIIVGRKGGAKRQVRILGIQTLLSDVDPVSLAKSLTNAEAAEVYGCSVSIHQRSVLAELVDAGWRSVLDSGRYATEVIQELKSLSCGMVLVGGNYSIKRGSLGNQGASKLLALDSARMEDLEILKSLPAPWLRACLENAVEIKGGITGRNDARKRTFVPSEAAYIDGTDCNAFLMKAVDTHLRLNGEKRKKKQSTKPKSKAELTRIVQKTRNAILSAGAVIVPRGVRREGVITTAFKGIAISTNFLVVGEESSVVDKLLLASWLSSVFGQLQLEYYGVPQEGMRKIEKKAIEQVVAPDFSNIAPVQARRLRRAYYSSSPVDSRAIQTREIDVMWAEVIAGADRQEILSKATQALQELVAYRLSGEGRAPIPV